MAPPDYHRLDRIEGNGRSPARAIEPAGPANSGEAYPSLCTPSTASARDGNHRLSHGATVRREPFSIPRCCPVF